MLVGVVAMEGVWSVTDELDQKMREGKMLCVESLLVCHSHIQMVPLL